MVHVIYFVVSACTSLSSPTGIVATIASYQAYNAFVSDRCRVSADLCRVLGGSLARAMQGYGEATHVQN